MWQGSAVFDCPNHSNEIVLRHINFGSSVSGECNNGAIIGESLGFNENSYTSQLSILYKDEFAGRNVTCIHDNGITLISLLSLTIVHNNIGTKLILKKQQYSLSLHSINYFLTLHFDFSVLSISKQRSIAFCCSTTANLQLESSSTKLCCYTLQYTSTKLWQLSKFHSTHHCCLP